MFKTKIVQTLADLYNILSMMKAEDYRTLIERVKLLCISNENCPRQKSYKQCQLQTYYRQKTDEEIRTATYRKYYQS